MSVQAGGNPSDQVTGIRLTLAEDPSSGCNPTPPPDSMVTVISDASGNSVVQEGQWSDGQDSTSTCGGGGGGSSTAIVLPTSPIAPGSGNSGGSGNNNGNLNGDKGL